MSWAPTSEELEAAKSELAGLPKDGVWYTPHQQAIYRRDGEADRLVLIKRLDHPMVEEAHENMKSMVTLIGWEVVEDADLELIPAWHPSPEEAELQERMRMQEMLMQTVCPAEGCEVYIVAMDLEEVEWRHLGDATSVDEEGMEQEEEVWVSTITCYACETDIDLAPYHYQILAGDELAGRWKTKDGVVYEVLMRNEVVSMVDNKSEDMIVLGTFCPSTQEVVPPPYRGLMMKVTKSEEEE